MNKYSYQSFSFLLLVFIICISACNTPNQIIINESLSPEDNFARNFINKLNNGDLNGSLADINPAILNDTIKNSIYKTSRSLYKKTLKNYKILESFTTVGIGTKSGKTTSYKLTYEFELEQGYLLFTIIIYKVNDQLYIQYWNGQFDQASVAEITKLSFNEKPWYLYFWLLLGFASIMFIIITLINMLKSRLTNKQKMIWTLLIIVLALPCFMVNWRTGKMSIQLFFIHLPSSGFTKPGITSDWMLYVALPLGAMIYWLKRDQILAIPKSNEEEESTVENNVDDSLKE